MNKTTKINLLYQIAHGQKVSLTAEERRALKKYKVYGDDANYATKANITSYVNEVDKGYPLSFYDWCQNRCKADRRRRGSSVKDMTADNWERNIGAMMLGWLIWGLAIYWMFGGTLEVKSCAIAGAVVSAVLLNLNRRLAGFTLFLLPIILGAFFFYH